MYNPISMEFQKKNCREHIKRGTSKLFYIKTNEQQSDIITKTLAKQKNEYLSKHIVVW